MCFSLLFSRGQVFCNVEDCSDMFHIKNGSEHVACKELATDSPLQEVICDMFHIKNGSEHVAHKYDNWSCNNSVDSA